ncbi:hypothetical protein GOP47_0018332 [Adiantum capillus-veneris]|uniref:Secreted protein n=1 Tax=Adiantum capillus-veneris TaxID=13818 RepID=A0A9D4UH44_ADICA|nr:hypothetical protein GOP47_0018332 [Adiantum capillus-veneris]
MGWGALRWVVWGLIALLKESFGWAAGPEASVEGSTQSRDRIAPGMGLSIVPSLHGALRWSNISSFWIRGLAAALPQLEEKSLAGLVPVGVADASVCWLVGMLSSPGLGLMASGCGESCSDLVCC